MKKKKIKIGLIPSDFIECAFISNGDCALARAAKRHFKVKKISCDGVELDILADDASKFSTRFTQRFYIVDGFGWEDFEYVREQYSKDPKMKEVQYEVTLIEK